MQRNAVASLAEEIPRTCREARLTSPQQVPTMSSDCTLVRSYARRARSSQEFAAAQFLIDSGFRPTEVNGMVRHISTGQNLGRTLSSVWRAMHILVDSVDLDSTVYRRLRLRADGR